ncbi:hypothetical protein EXIGLDRAFT_839016 [Exidia glandulosa HHB12029]|uniref:Uncharacterized protein n=1 Tax=Exidia glandulosa HHB12029 TaxID=1314781 RepID=A0A166A5L0_EXIGL|nr:hypothetical protein EXIGLDRAFT_839016 [Exidia glandulosa HHB12029]
MWYFANEISFTRRTRGSRVRLVDSQSSSMRWPMLRRKADFVYTSSPLSLLQPHDDHMRHFESRAIPAVVPGRPSSLTSLGSVAATKYIGPSETRLGEQLLLVVPIDLKSRVLFTHRLQVRDDRKRLTQGEELLALVPLSLEVSCFIYTPSRRRSCETR